MDPRDQLAPLAGPKDAAATEAEAASEAETATQAEAAAEAEARSRRALRRRRAKQAVVGSGLALAALGTVFVLTTDGGGGGGPAATDSTAAVSTTQLVAYKGKQPKGFTLDKVPDGWFVQTDDEVNVLLAPARKAGRPNALPSVDPLNDPQSYVGKIGVMLQSGSVGGPGPGTPVVVGDRKGVLVRNLGGDGAGSTLWIEQPGGVYVLIQFWEDFGLSQAQMVDFGAGVHVVKRVKPSAG